MPRRSWFAVFLLACSPALLTAQESYRIKVRKDKAVGDTSHVTEVETTTQKTKITDAAGKVLQDKEVKPSRNVVYTEKTLAIDGAKASRLVRKYDRADMADDGREVGMPIIGRDISIVRSAGKYDFSYADGGLPPERVLRMLQDAYRNKEDEDKFNEMVFGTDPVAVGSTRKVDGGEVLKGMFKSTGGIELDTAKATGSMRLKEVYKKDGATFGKLTIEVSSPILTVGTQKVKALDVSTVSLSMEMDACIDGSRTEGKVEGTMELKFNAKVPVNGAEASLSQSVSSKLTETRKMVKK